MKYLPASELQPGDILVLGDISARIQEIRVIGAGLCELHFDPSYFRVTPAPVIYPSERCVEVFKRAFPKDRSYEGAIENLKGLLANALYIVQVRGPLVQEGREPWEHLSMGLAEVLKAVEDAVLWSSKEVRPKE